MNTYLYTRMYYIGTTDSFCELTDNPRPTEKEVQFILSEIRSYLSSEISGILQIAYLFTVVTSSLADIGILSISASYRY